MSKRTRISIEQIAAWHNLQKAAYLAAKGKRSRLSVVDFFNRLDRNLTELGRQLRSGELAPTTFRSFVIRDPKRRIIHAPSFHDRVLHHAIMLHAGPPINNSLTDDSYACRTGKGPIAAVHRAQGFSRRFHWYAKMDVKQYFSSIDHARLSEILSRRFKGAEFLALMDGIIGSFSTKPGCGLPIGTLTSQHFANLYLDGADRWLMALPKVRSVVRYMDDIVCWFDTRLAAVESVDMLKQFFASDLKLTMNPKWQINRVDHGLPLCGHRIFPGTIKLSRRRQRLYINACNKWEKKFTCAEISAAELQQGYASAFAIVKHADSKSWRQHRIDRHLVHEA